MGMNILKLITTVFFFTISCDFNESHELASSMTLPTGVNWTTKDGVLNENINIMKPYKIVVYNKSTFCNSCSLNLENWKTFISNVDTSKVGFLFIFNYNNNPEEVYNLLNIYEFDYPIFVDKYDSFRINNKALKMNDVEYFLLDKNNSIIYSESPLKNNLAFIELFNKLSEL